MDTQCHARESKFNRIPLKEHKPNAFNNNSSKIYSSSGLFYAALYTVKSL